MLGLEAIVELFRDFIHVQGSPDPTGNIHNRDGILLIHADGNLIESLNQRITGLIHIKTMVPAGQGLARFPADPMPDLPAILMVGIDHEMLPYRLGDLVIDFQSRGPIRNRGADKCDKAPFLGDGRQANGVVAYRNVQPGMVIIPAQVLTKQC